jgi:hypothetical protein
VFNVVDRRGHRPFEERDDAFLHLFGREAAVTPDNADYRDIDIRKNIDRHGNDGRYPKNGDKYRYHNEGIGTS